jgi:hypothetical protein
MEHVKSQHIKSPFVPGFRFIDNEGYVYQVVKLTERRAYVELVDATLDPASRQIEKVAFHLGYGIHTHGYRNTGKYVENQADNMRMSRAVRVLSISPTIGPVELARAIRDANAAGEPFALEAARLRALADEQDGLRRQAMLAVLVLCADAAPVTPTENPTENPTTA